MFLCSNARCDTYKTTRSGRPKRVIEPGEKPVEIVTQVRRIRYMRGEDIISVGSEIVNTIKVCRTCAETEYSQVEPMVVEDIRRTSFLPKRKKRRRKEDDE